MKLGNIALRLRDKTTLISYIGGAADYEVAMHRTLDNNVVAYAFVVPVQEIADRNEYESAVEQVIRTRFGVILAVRNDTNNRDKTGFLAYNMLDSIRNEIFGAFVGFDIAVIDTDSDKWSSNSLIEFYDGQLLDINAGYLWYQYTFEYRYVLPTQIVDEPADYLDTLYTQYELEPSDNVPIDESLPVTSFEPDTEETLDLEALRNN